MNPKLLARRGARRAGFSLAELMVVIVIIGLLAGIVVPNVVGYLGRAMTGRVKADVASIVQAIDQYAIHNAGKYPESLEDLIEPPEEGQAPYLKGGKIPLDPWKNEYLYDAPTEGDNYRVYTLGKDGSPGGEKDDADFDNTQLN
ncbi:MAG TPA: type II secretion system major pseudopilin GspG [Planctomycetota bacterium]|nr:type II secretion system major pseudopilin GspG [Planctomycetota bacterium]